MSSASPKTGLETPEPMQPGHINEEFAREVEAGLTASPKRLSSKYFYDSKGSALFAQIMDLPEYYLTDAELEILKEQSPAIMDRLGIDRETPFELVELGAGDGVKTIELLKHLEAGGYRYRYVPIDISQQALDQLEKNIRAALPDKRIQPKKGDYFKKLSELSDSDTPKVVLFLGSNLGNMKDDRAHGFIKSLADNLPPGDKLLLGTDLMKDASIVLPAYNDSQGVTRDFNLNLLKRINRELGADFDLDAFTHAPEYDEKEGITKSYLRSEKDQEVSIRAIGKTIPFQRHEKIHTEISRKYNDAILEDICRGTGMKVIGKFTDHRDYFADYVLEKA